MINGHTKVFGIIGNPIEHTASPLLHNTLFEHFKLNCVYVPFKIEPTKLGAFITAVKAANIAGLNVTIPFKEQVILFLDELDITAQHIGAVNTIVNKHGELIGYNTDGAGFITSITNESGIDLKGKTALIIGAGGAAKAVAFSLLQAQVKELILVNRTKEKAEQLADKLNLFYATKIISADLARQPELNQLLAKADIVINSTPMGMEPLLDQSPLTDFSWVTKEKLVCDLIYKPAKTIFLQQAESQGAKILSGLGMLAAQGVLAFELFTGKKADYASTRQLLENVPSAQ